ncbi:phage tail sheath subtilisin-like domain-containing protein [bacterium]|nr:phage tail sheath subtilisin-like domain-containing protein [bacterium]
MATSYKTPGVYIEEIPKLPPSIAQVETAIPAFVGYTEIAVKNGESLTLKPTRISSLLEFEEYFGGEHVPASVTVVVDDANNYAVDSVTLANSERFYLYDSMRLFFDNGGGDCYIVSVGNFDNAPELDGANSSMLDGLRALEKEDEPTILLFPDACNISVDDPTDTDLYSLQQQALAQCAKLQDRVAVFDLHEHTIDDHDQAVASFRNNIGINSLKYGAAYTPWLITSYPRTVDFPMFRTGVTRLSDSGAVDLGSITSDSTLNALVTTFNSAEAESAAVEAVITNIRSADATDGSLGGGTTLPTMKDKFMQMKLQVDASGDETAATANLNILLNFCRLALLDFQSLLGTLTTANMLNDLATYAKSNTLWRGAATAMIGLDRNADVDALSTIGDVNTAYSGIDLTWLGAAAPASVTATGTDYGDPGTASEVPGIARMIALDLQSAFNMLSAFADALREAASEYQTSAQEALYEKHSIIGNIVSAIEREWSKLPPSGAVAGIYARVDGTRGVWKAPANESIASVSGPLARITHEEQASLNVDSVAGKSINAIRNFTGRGTLVWGARTLKGNDNEWRYVNVRRFFNMVEESTKNATAGFVFEPNDANTWVKVQAMIENFLTVLWRQGALQGAKPEHAFYVSVGLGKTMTALDILEGRMIVEIGMAVVRPAEFIILRFSHKMAES